MALSLSSRGFGYAVLEGNDRLVQYGTKTYYDDHKNAWLLGQAIRLIARYQPDSIVLRDLLGDKNRSRRVKELHRKIMRQVRKLKIKAVTVSGKMVRVKLLDNPQTGRHEMAIHLAERFPDELARLLPSKRKPWSNEHPRMDLFDAVGLVVGIIKMPSGP